MNQNNEYIFISTNKEAIKQLKENSNKILILGILFTILGTLSIMFSFYSTIISVLFIGALFLSAGVMEGTKSFTVNRWDTFFLHLFLSIMFIVGGIFIIFHPAANAISLTLLIAIFFAVFGTLKIIFALTKQTHNRFWLLINGAIELILGILLWQQWPISGLWVLGTFLGIEILITGWTYIMLAINAKSLKS